MLGNEKKISKNIPKQYKIESFNWGIHMMHMGSITLVI